MQKIAQLRIYSDLDNTLLDFYGPFNSRFPNLDWSDQDDISQKVESLKHDATFWENLPLIDTLDFEIEGFCTKRCNDIEFTINSLEKNGWHNPNVIQLENYNDRKSDYLKGICDVLLEDDYNNVVECNNAGIIALLIDRPSNRHINTKYRIYDLKYSTILTKYIELINDTI